MGAYLSKPICEKESEDREGDVLSYGACAMQGWRLSQEDAHSCLMDFDADTNTSLFAVYDGHGGSEVAQYAALYFPEFLKGVSAYTDGNLDTALENAFLEFDATLVTEDVKKKLKVLAAGAEKAAEDEEADEETRGEAKHLREEATMPIEELLERYGGAGLLFNRNLAGLKKGSKFPSPAIRAKPNVDDDNDSPASQPEESEPADDVGNSGGIPSLPEKDEVRVNLADSISNGFCPEDVDEEGKPCNVAAADKSISGKTVDADDVTTTSVQENGETNCPDSSKVECSSSSGGGECDPGVTESGPSSSTDCKEAGTSSAEVEAGPSSSEGPSSSTAEAGASSSGASCSKEAKDSSEEETTDEDEDSEDEQWNSDESGNDSDDEAEEEEGEEDVDDDEDEDDDDDEDAEENEDEEGMSFGEEPGADSGCTAVVAMLRDGQLFVANAGDSRCVLCRDGKAVNMSVDHKPEDPSEQDRIMKAGGRVTCDGRVNGGLNLSRALGDHIYKKNSSVTDRDQMITALPDIMTMSLDTTDEFMVLACDGIWNVMSSQDVVDFVKQRLQAGVTKLSAICEEMFDFCLAPDTNGDGTGCDNMTCIIIVFKNLLGASSSAIRSESKRKAEADPDSTDAADASSATKRPRDDDVAT